MRLPKTLFAFCAATHLSAAVSHAEPTLIHGVDRIVDGDTLDVGPVRVRLHGIDAPEAGQRCERIGGGTWPCGEKAIHELALLAGEKWLSCHALDRDAYGRIIAICKAGDVELNDHMVRVGLAWAFTRFSDDYLALETEVRATGRGIWQAPTQTAWEYREDKWNRAAAESPRPGCPIKGNISNGDERIYHTSWSPWYDRTSVDDAKGERWFCDEAEAVEAGWRAPYWR